MKSAERREMVNHPRHYGGDTTYEVIKVIEAWGLGFCLGNCVKYVARADHKDNTLEDLKKAQWYLAREIAKLEKEKDAKDTSRLSARQVGRADVKSKRLHSSRNLQRGRRA